MEILLLFPYQVCILVLLSSAVLPQLSYTHIPLQFKPGQVDTWTLQSSGCPCTYNEADYTCACCTQGGCNCDESSKHRCVQCGLESSCGNVCNITLHSADIQGRSGRSTGELKSSADMRGPTLCWFRFMPGIDERVEVHLYRVLRVGEYDASKQRCQGGGLSFQKTEGVPVAPANMFVCGRNERYSPPLVLFQDVEEGNSAHPVLVVSIEERTERSQFLAHFSFTKRTDSITGLRSLGGVRIQKTDCDWEYSDCMLDHCEVSSPGYPGIFNQNMVCRYLFGKPNTKIRISFRFVRINLPRGARSCESTYLAIYKGEREVHRVCGEQEEEEYQVESTSFHRVHLVFRSSRVIPPFVHNGFLAVVQSSPVEERDSKDSSPSPLIPSISIHSTNLQSSPLANPLKPPETNLHNTILPYLPADVRVYGCNEEVQGDVERVGRVSSSQTPFTTDKCSFVFRGSERDILLISFLNVILRDDTCSSTLKLSIQDPNSESGVRVLQEYCSSQIKLTSFPLVVNSSLVFLDFKTGKSREDTFTAAFKFQNVLTEGYPRPNSSCDINIFGDGFPFLPKLQGFLNTPTELGLFGDHQGPVNCEYRLQTGVNQSLVLTISATSPALSSPTCFTGCDGTGCQCMSSSNMEDVNHILVISATSEVLGCFCGHFQKVLPAVYRVQGHISLVYHQPTNQNQAYQQPNNKKQVYYQPTNQNQVYHQPANANFYEDSLKFRAQYKFMRSIVAECEYILHTSSQGSIERPMVRSTDEPYYEDCVYMVEPPPHRVLHLEVKLPQPNSVSCEDWEMFLWTQPRKIRLDQYINSNKSSGYETTLKPPTDFEPAHSRTKDNVGRLCGDQRTFSVLDMWQKRLFIRASGLSKTKIGYKISWFSEHSVPLHNIHQSIQENGGLTGRHADGKTNSEATNTLALPTLFFSFQCWKILTGTSSYSIFNLNCV